MEICYSKIRKYPKQCLFSYTLHANMHANVFLGAEQKQSNKNINRNSKVPTEECSVQKVKVNIAYRCHILGELDVSEESFPMSVEGLEDIDRDLEGGAEHDDQVQHVHLVLLRLYGRGMIIKVRVQAVYVCVCV